MSLKKNSCKFKQEFIQMKWIDLCSLCRVMQIVPDFRQGRKLTWQWWALGNESDNDKMIETGERDSLLDKSSKRVDSGQFWTCGIFPGVRSSSEIARRNIFSEIKNWRPRWNRHWDYPRKSDFGRPGRERNDSCIEFFCVRQIISRTSCVTILIL